MIRSKSSTSTAVETETDVDRDDVDDVIGLAARLDMEAEDRLTIEEVEAVAAELDIEPQHVREAARTLKDDRAAARAEAVARASLRRKIMAVAAAAVTAVLLGLAALTGVGHTGLTNRYAAVEASRAQVVSVLERQEKVETRYRGLTLDRDREAEIIGAENRVRVETRRYDTAAAEYNRYASGLSASLARAAFDHPARVKLSGEGAAWGGP